MKTSLPSSIPDDPWTTCTTTGYPVRMVPFHQHLATFRASMSSEEKTLLLEKLQERVPDNIFCLVKAMIDDNDDHASMMAAKGIIEQPVKVLLDLVGSLDGIINEDQTESVRLMFESISDLNASV